MRVKRLLWPPPARIFQRSNLPKSKSLRLANTIIRPPGEKEGVISSAGLCVSLTLWEPSDRTL